MKRIVLFSLTFFISFSSLFAQTWVEMMHDPTANFYDIQSEFNSYWQNRPMEKGKGYKQFRRWEDFMAPRVYPSGNLTDAGRAYQEYKDWLHTHPQTVTGPRAGNWTSLGPVGKPSGGGAGRINFIRFDPTNSNILWAGAPAGGLWKSTDGGTTWVTTTDNLGVIGVTDLAIDPTNTQVMYLATGDGDAQDTYSIGVLKSTDGGTTWAATGLAWQVTQGRSISRLLIHPSNNQILIAFASNGIWKTTNAGTSWTQVQTGNFKDAEFKPGDPSTIYACGTTFWKSTDTGNSFTQVTSGVPASGVGRLAIAVTPANSAYVYLLAANSSDYGLTGVYRSTNSGTSFSTRATSPNLLGWNSSGGDSGGQGWYDLAIAASETNADVVVVGGVNIWRSTNGGTNWSINGHWTGSGAPYVHADIHDLIFVPGSGTTYYSGNDGGVFVTTNSGSSWIDISGNLEIAQQYKIGLSASTESLLVAGHQDNGTNKMNGTSWTEIYGGDGMDCMIDYTNDNIIYASYVYGEYKRSTNGGASWTTITTGLSGNAAWLAPIEQDPSVNTTIYCGYTNVFKSTNQGTSWSQISSFSGSGTIVDIEVAPSSSQVIYAARSSSLYKTTNGGTSWSVITGTLPVASAAITFIEVSPTDANKVYVTFSGYSSGNKIFRSTDGGTTWTNISSGLPNLPVNCVVYQDGSADGIYVGTDVGVYYLDNNLPTWQSFMTGLPNVVVKELEIYYPTQKIRAATFGRGTWESALYDDGTNPPAAEFSASQTMICPGESITFTDLSSASPTAWSWTFTGGTPSTSSAQNPVVIYNTPGTYAVTLTATNANGSDTETKTAYITVMSTQTLPLTEGFEGGFLPANWNLSDGGNDGITWSHNTSVGGFGTSSSSTYFDNYNNNANGTLDWIISPLYSFSGLTSATLTFDVAYARYSATYSDSLIVAISVGCSTTYTALYYNGGTSLSTNGGANVQASIFVPTSAQWRTETIDLSAYAGQQNVRIAFINRGLYGQAIYLDNINITGTGALLPVADFSASSTTICAGESISFTNLSTDATGYTWTFTGGTPATSTNQNPTVTYSSAGVYEVTLVATNASGSDTETKTSYITVNASPAATAGSNSPVCEGSSINLTAATVTGASYSWTGPNGFTSSLQNPSIASATTGNAGTYTLTVTANGCSSSSSTTVTVNANPTATAGSNSPVCEGSSINLTAATVTGGSYSWTGPNGFTSSIQNPSIASAATGNAGTYTLTVTANGCSSSSSTTVTVNTNPTATAGSNSPVCEGSSINLTAATVTGGSYSWTGPNGFTSSLQNPSIASAATGNAGTYTLTVTANGCSSSSSTTVTVNASPASTAGSNSPVCEGSSINLTAATVTGASYSWTGPNGFTSSLQNPSIASAATGNAGTYTLTVTASGCSSSSSTTVTVNASPTATAGSNSPVCEGSSINLTAATVTGASYSWSGPNGFTSSIQNPSIASAATGNAGTYTLTVTANGCSSSSSTTVTVNTSPAATAGSNSPVCEGSSINLTAATVTGGSYSWTGPNGFTSSLQNPSIASATTGNAGTYTLIVTANGCSSSSSSTTVTVNTNPTATAGSNSPVCEGSSINLTAATVTGGSYSWTGPNGFTSSLQNPSIASAATGNAGNYTLIVTANGCSSSSSSTTVTVNASPAATAGSNSPVCEGNSINLTAATVTGASYSWTGPNGFTSSLQNPSIASATTGNAGTYTLTVTANGCSSSSSTTVTVNASPAATAGSNSPVCEGSSINLTAATVTGASYSWTGPNGFTSSLQNPSIASATTGNAGTYTLTVTANGCSSVSTTIVAVNSTPAVSASGNSPVCTGQTLNLTATTVSGASYSWSGPNGFTSSLQNPVISTVTAAMAGSYTVTVNNGCTVSSSAAIVINTSPLANAGSNSPVCEGNTINLTAAAVTGASYSWTGPNGFTSSLQNPSIASATTGNTGTYTLTVTANGCSSSSSITVTVNADPAAMAGSNSPLCEGSSINLTAATVTGASYSWTGPNGFTSSLQNPSVASATTGNAGIYTLTVTANGCSATSSTNVTVNTSPVATAGSNSPICAGQTINLTAATVTGASYSWSGPGGFLSTQQNPSIPLATTGSSGIYTLTVTLNGCSSVSTSTVTVNSLPSVTASGNSPVCAGQNITLNSSAVTGASYSWTGPNGYISSQQNPVINNATTAMAGTYTVTVTSNGCSVNATTGVVVNTSSANATNYSPVCEGIPVSLFADTLTGATYSWTGPNGFTSNNQNPFFPDPLSADSGSYILSVTVNGCVATDTTLLIINSSPAAFAGNDVSLCEGDSVSLSATGGNTYSWLPVSGLSSANSPTPNASPDTTTVYSVLVTGNNGCMSNDEVTVTVDLPVTVDAGTDQTICEGDTIQLAAITSGTVTWTPAALLDDPASTSPLAFPSTTTTYSVTAANGACSATDNILLTVLPAPVTPVITMFNGDLQSTAGPSYQWYLDGVPISGANAQTYTPTVNGTYTVEVNDGCSSFSTPFVLTNVGIDELSEVLIINLYPNPGNGFLTMEITGSVTLDHVVEIYNSIGQIVYSLVIPVTEGTTARTDINISDKAAGIYSVIVSAGDEKIVRKVIIL